MKKLMQRKICGDSDNGREREELVGGMVVVRRVMMGDEWIINDTIDQKRIEERAIKKRKGEKKGEES